MNRTEYIGKLNALYVGDKNCLEELITTYDEKGKEIERLKKELEEYKKDFNEVNNYAFKLHSIIKEAREYTNKYFVLGGNTYKEKVLEILDKGE